MEGCPGQVTLGRFRGEMLIIQGMGLFCQGRKFLARLWLCRVSNPFEVFHEAVPQSQTL